MRQGSLINSGKVIVPKLSIARDFLSRFLGLMGRRGLPQDEALFFPKCNSIHTFFMRFPIDVVFLDADGNVVEVIENLKAWRMLLPRSKAKHIIEFAGNRTRDLGLRSGMRLEWRESNA